MLIITPAVVLWRWPLGEHDRTVCLYTQKLGLINVRAWGVYKPRAKLRVFTEPFVEIEAWLSYRPHAAVGKLLSAVLINSHPFLRCDVEKTAAAAYISELTRELCLPLLPDQNVFDLIRQSIKHIENVREDESYVRKDVVVALEGARRFFAIRFVELLGHGKAHSANHINQHLRAPLKSELFIKDVAGLPL